MTTLTVTVVALASALMGYAWGNQKAFDEFMDSEEKAKAFWEEVEQRGLK